jgi:hypothetical protein
VCFYFFKERVNHSCLTALKITTLPEMEVTMKKFFTLKQAARCSLLTLTLGVAGITFAQDDNDVAQHEKSEQRRQIMAQRRAEFRENNPEAAARFEERQRERQEFRTRHPEAAEKMAQQRRQMREHRETGMGPGRGNRFEDHADG